ncbi:transcriptional repressor [Candidatus Gracilibacteria bacterium]|nr:transcriptional repressor [Candidatus Gracilibacteria bacterium]
MRQTKTRQEILTFLENNQSAFTPYEIGEKLSINTVTVYRVLDFLKEQKLVHHIPSLSKWSACQCHEANQDHGFLICRKCDSVEEFLSPHHCIHHHDFQCEEHILEIMGTCKSCSKK